MPFISMRVINAVQHLYLNVAAPSLFFPLGIVLVSSRILPQLFGYAVTAFAGIQAIWWLAAACTLAIRSQRLGQVHLDA
jgi:hypothetical protein